MTRLLRLSSSPSAYQQASCFTTYQLLHRGYPWRLIQSARAFLPFARREAALRDRELEAPGRVLPFVCGYSHRILDTGPNRFKPTLAFTKGRTLAKSLVRARLRGVPRPPTSSTIQHTPIFGTVSAPCETALCVCCRAMSKRPTAFSSDNRAWFKCSTGTTCDTSNCVYLLQCSGCTKQHMYVGQTARPLKTRLNGHRQASSKPSRRPLYVHMPIGLKIFA